MAKALAEERGFVVAITGQTDYVSDGKRVFAIKTGHKYLPQLTGTGCSATATISCFIGVNKADVCMAYCSLSS